MADLTNRVLAKAKGFLGLGPKLSHAEKFASIKPDFSDYASPEAYVGLNYQYVPIVSKNWTGEKNFGELGAAVQFYPEYQILALRSWQAYTESELAKLVIDNYVMWTIGTGLRLQSEPKLRILQQENVPINDEAINNFTLDVEARFSLHANSRYCSYNRLDNLHSTASEIQKNAVISGDVLVILRYFKNGGVNIETVDGQKVGTPIGAETFVVDAEARGNTIRHGIEINSRRGHVAFFVRDDEGNYSRIPAKGSATGRTTAFMVYGTKYRLDYVRGLPLVSVVLEVIKKLERYKEATVGSAEERQKIAFSIEHQLQAEGENPLLREIMNSKDLNGVGIDKDTEPDDGILSENARRIAATTGKTVINMPVGSQLKSLESKNELYFKEFYSTNIDIICAALGIPPEVALMKYESSFSSARMAAKSWEISLKVRRAQMEFQFYKPFYNFWLQMEVLRGKINAPRYIENMRNTDKSVILSYHECRFMGMNVPNVDPLKEVKAERAKLGSDIIPITTLTKVAEALGEGDFSENIKKYNAEVSNSGFVKPEQPNQGNKN